MRKSVEEKREKIIEVLDELEWAGPTRIAKRAGLSTPTTHRLLTDLAKEGRIETDAGVYRRPKPQIEERVKVEISEAHIIAYAPFCPVVSGAHSVLRGEPALIFPMNAYVAVGISKTGGRGGRVPTLQYPSKVMYRSRGQSSPSSEIEIVKERIVDLACEIAELSRRRMPNLGVRWFSTFDISSGLGGSGALAVAIALAFLSVNKKISTPRPLEGTKEFDLVFRLAYKIEEYIHGKGTYGLEGPFSSGASVLGSMLGGSEGSAYKYRVGNIDSLKLGTDDKPKYHVEKFPMKLPLTHLDFILGRPKVTRDCIFQVKEFFNHSRSILGPNREPVGKKVEQTFFELWRCLTSGLEIALKEGNSAQVAELLNIQNGLYFSIGLSSDEFTLLASKIAKIDGVGGSIIGGGKGGAFLICTEENIDTVKQIVWSDPSLVCVPLECIGQSWGGRIMRTTTTTRANKARV